MNSLPLSLRPVNFRHYLKWKLGASSAYSQTSLSERQCLRKYATGKNKIVEIGVFEGVNTKNFREVMKPDGLIIAVDPYPRTLGGLLGFGWIRRIAHSEVEDVSRGNVIWLETLGHLAPTAEKVKSQLPIDFIFIDGDHSYEGLRGDWEAWSDCIEPGGIVALHDSANFKDMIPGSQRFTQENVLKDKRFSLIEVVDTLTVLKRN